MLWERYTERARKAMLHAEDWAIRLRSTHISPEHILLGLLEEKDTLAVQMLERLGVDVHKMKSELENQLKAQAPAHPPVGSPALNAPAKQVLIHVADEAKSLGDSHIDTGHLLLALLREKQGLAAKILAKYNVRYEDVRKRLHELREEVQSITKPTKPPEFPPKPLKVSEFVEDLTAKATEGEFRPVSLWQRERERFVVALLRKEVPNILLLVNFETALLLAQQFACDLVNNPFLQERRLLRLDWTKLQSDAQVMSLLAELTKQDVKPLLFVGTVDDIFHWSDVMLAAVQNRLIPVLAVATQKQWEDFQNRYPVAASTFVVITVDEPDEQQTLEWLKVHKSVYEFFHRVMVDDEALVAVMNLAKERFANLPLLATAKKLLDEVCAYAKVKAFAPPPEVQGINAEISRLQGEKEKALSASDHERAAKISEQIAELQKRLDEALREYHRCFFEELPKVTPETVQEFERLI
ncbi:Clp amino terminal domain-containing protein, pathogenicity island component [Candidatus Fervidibacteria bacterium JGI MDM2 SSWTFF-3-K9]